METLNTLAPLLKTFWFVAIPVSIVFLIQTVLTFIGLDTPHNVDADLSSDTDGHGDVPGSHFQFFSLRNLINFLLGFSWTGIAYFTTITQPAVLIACAILVGCLFVYIFFLVIKQIQKLAEDNTFKMSSTINKTAEVYLSIPANRSGMGKIMISINGSFHELDAMTNGPRIPTGAVIKVVEIENDNILIVQTI